ncbi:uncharacterized protein LOC129582777 isoform X2 [Paramacrobiotus metropolitanus]|uniref:uncharacterized protein LOC129582777 isoform X2 n=1 Tax=Paramacrobiotus metropolitanus TaxID=2943436 RepID=UPI002445D864|nr:uncharacterized protein LOC129582777 isoform X2 [Paramacrobiotus metropolitanus]
MERDGKDNHHLINLVINGQCVLRTNYRLLMQIAPDYFGLLFSQESYTEKEPKDISLILPVDVDVSTAKRLLENLLNSEDPFDEHKTGVPLAQLLVTANHFGLAEIAGKCAERLELIVNRDNCCYLWKLANSCDQPKLGRRAASELFQCDLHSLGTSETFLEYSRDEFSWFLSHESLTAQNEKDIFSLIISWCQFDKGLRWNVDVFTTLSKLHWDQLVEDLDSLTGKSHDPLLLSSL